MVADKAAEMGSPVVKQRGTPGQPCTADYLPAYTNEALAATDAHREMR